ncbi:maleate cis-trans isomerase family protein [Pararobbsia alpina]|uniref:Maleate isomerase n=1 Tax=Pararobbsia alpina TaxID=621374 RepID=A0A6S7B1Y5_9BURK|nr:aspartate/glutamate racemase family protein [Pararobbsia alpina]CAB3782766.1 Maleate isomerase [Pararobbsia alpina]
MSVPESIDYGSRGRIGVIVPSGNSVAEPQIRAMLPPGVQAYVTRLPLLGSSSEELINMASQARQAANLLTDAGVECLAFHCTAASTYSVELNDLINRQVQVSEKAHSFATADAIVHALRCVDARRVVLLTPYIEPVNEREVAFLTHHGFEVIACEGLQINTNKEMAELPPSTFIEMALRNQRDDADAYLISCTAVRSAECIEALEASLKRPVITSNQAMVWYALRGCGVQDPVAGFGTLLDRDRAPLSAG